jgi:adenylate kinase
MVIHDLQPLDQTPVALVLFGSPGSGKGTQAKLLIQCLRVPQISTGDMLRERIREGVAAPNVRATMQAGSLVSDEVVNRLVEARVSEPDCQRGFILDGYPRTRDQAEHLCKYLEQRGIDEVVIHLVVDYNIIIARLTGRRQCPACGTLYNVVSKPPKADGVCDRDASALVIREDDRESVIRERLEAYENQTRPLLDYFRASGRKLYQVEASHETPDALFQKICRAVRGPLERLYAVEG